jgi:hypothetical protein
MFSPYGRSRARRSNAALPIAICFFSKVYGRFCSTSVEHTARNDVMKMLINKEHHEIGSSALLPAAFVNSPRVRSVAAGAQAAHPPAPHPPAQIGWRRGSPDHPQRVGNAFPALIIRCSNAPLLASAKPATTWYAHLGSWLKSEVSPLLRRFDGLTTAEPTSLNTVTDNARFSGAL